MFKPGVYYMCMHSWRKDKFKEKVQPEQISGKNPQDGRNVVPATTNDSSLQLVNQGPDWYVNAGAISL